MFLPSQTGELPTKGRAKLFSMLEQSTVVSKFKTLFLAWEEAKKNFLSQWKRVSSQAEPFDFQF